MKKINKLMLVVLLFGISSLASAQTGFDDDVDDVGNTVSIIENLYLAVFAAISIGFIYFKYSKNINLMSR